MKLNIWFLALKFQSFKFDSERFKTHILLNLTFFVPTSLEVVGG
jgi:hypothetical protein